MVKSKTGKVKTPLKIGVTGGIGSGKSTVCQIFEYMGVPIYNSDLRAKKLMVENEAVQESVKFFFGESAYLPTGELNSAHLASIVFKDKTMLEKLNSVVHPAVFADAAEWHDSQTGVPYTIREAALLIESGSYQNLDKLIVVTAPEQVRIERVVKRDGTRPEQVKARMDKQLPEAEKVALADFVINNDGQHSLVEQVVKIHRQLTELAQTEISES